MASMPADAALSDQRKSLGGQPEHLEVLSKAIGDLAASRPPFAHEGMVASLICVTAKAESRRPSDSSGRPSPTPLGAVGMAELSLDRNDPGWGHSCGRASAADTFRWQTRLSGPPPSSSP